jgi:hypothetical protein
MREAGEKVKEGVKLKRRDYEEVRDNTNHKGGSNLF